MPGDGNMYDMKADYWKDRVPKLVSVGDYKDMSNPELLREIAANLENLKRLAAFRNELLLELVNNRQGW